MRKICSPRDLCQCGHKKAYHVRLRTEEMPITEPVTIIGRCDKCDCAQYAEIPDPDEVKAGDKVMRCLPCDGTGHTEHGFKDCKPCEGRGYVVVPGSDRKAERREPDWDLVLRNGINATTLEWLSYAPGAELILGQLLATAMDHPRFKGMTREQVINAHERFAQIQLPLDQRGEYAGL